jgi:hypothetical protein
LQTDFLTGGLEHPLFSCQVSALKKTGRNLKMRGTADCLKIALPVTVGLLLAFAFLWPDGREARVTDQLRKLTGSPARMVWSRQVKEDADDVFVRGNHFQLMGFDTEDRQGERVIIRETGNFHKPMITAQGDRVVFTDLPAKKIYAVNWNGTGRQELASGLAVEVWMDPQTGIEWVYRLQDTRAVDTSASMHLTRFQLDNPPVQETVLDNTPLSSDNLQLSRDGAFMSGQFPWPTCGVIDMARKQTIELGKGCWTSLSPDNSYLMWIFDGPHRNLIFHTADGKRKWTVNINGAPGIKGHEVYHPRWSNQARFMCMTGPYAVGIPGGGSQVNIYAGRFNETTTAVEEWVQLTSSSQADFYPDLWVKPGAGRYNRLDLSSAGEPAADSLPAEKLVVTGRLAEMTPVPDLEDIAPYTRTLVVYRYVVEQVISGKFEPSGLLVAHWGIVDSRETAPPRRIGESYRLELEPYSGRSELEGERLVMELSDMRYPLFYDVEGK